MKLLIDAGNSRIKWGVHDGEHWCAQGVADHTDTATLAHDWTAWPIDDAYGSLVANEFVGAMIEIACPCPVKWVGARTDGFGVHNHYRNPAQMGADRWLAVVAARQLCRQDVIVVCAGTALTIEALTRDGDYLGGVILPGLRTMLDSLAQKTARLNQPVGDYADFPACTEDALATGVLDALAGAVERNRQRLAMRMKSASPMVLITGGDAGQIAPLLASPIQIVDNLVLTGLLEVSNES